MKHQLAMVVKRDPLSLFFLLLLDHGTRQRLTSNINGGPHNLAHCDVMFRAALPKLAFLAIQRYTRDSSQ